MRKKLGLPKMPRTIRKVIPRSLKEQIYCFVLQQSSVDIFFLATPPYFVFSMSHVQSLCSENAPCTPPRLSVAGETLQEGDAWYIVEAAWVQRWLAFVQGGDSVKRPGPIKNENLLVRCGEREKNAVVMSERRKHSLSSVLWHTTDDVQKSVFPSMAPSYQTSGLCTLGVERSGPRDLPACCALSVSTSTKIWVSLCAVAISNRGTEIGAWTSGSSVNLGSNEYHARGSVGCIDANALI